MCSGSHKKAYFCEAKKNIIMSESTTKSKGIYWIIALISLVAIIALLAFNPAWFWVGLPFFITAVVMGMDIM